jgi:hypothetical protein
MWSKDDHKQCTMLSSKAFLLFINQKLEQMKWMAKWLEQEDGKEISA